MGQPKQKPLYDPASDYETDFYLWSYEQSELLRQRRFSELDLPNIIEEIESLGRSDKRALTSAYRVLLQHLLKWQFQPLRRGSSWLNTVSEQRRTIEMLEAESPSLRAKAEEFLQTAYPAARRDAAREMRVEVAGLPQACPFSIAQLRDFDWLPGEPSKD